MLVKKHGVLPNRNHNSTKELTMNEQIKLGKELIADTATVNEVASQVAKVLLDEIDQQHRRLSKTMRIVFQAADVKEPDGYSPLCYQFSAVAMGLKEVIEQTMPSSEGYGREPILQYQTTDVRVLPVYRQDDSVQLLEFLPVVNGGTIDTFDIESNHKWVLAGSNTSGEIYYVGFRVTTNGVSVAVSVSKSGVWKGFSTFTEDVFDKPLSAAPIFHSFIAIAYAIYIVNSRVEGRDWWAAPPPYSVRKQTNGQYHRK